MDVCVVNVVVDKQHFNDLLPRSDCFSSRGSRWLMVKADEATTALPRWQVVSTVLMPI